MDDLFNLFSGEAVVFAPYCEVRWVEFDLLPYGTRFGIPYAPSDVRKGRMMLPGQTVLSDPFWL